ncbi:Uncharacterised protein [Klebsiella variicola]|uniref:hypothetical protein n=1 Tax=Klebsiella variicola TaxID=244366 RepID=UPI000E2B75EA|nr:hypothetical protein [Klebsiella variicola]SXF12081.1 Uncharacterised protein [Klebsiella variicola]
MNRGWIFDAPGKVTDFREPLKWDAVMRNEAQEIVYTLASSVLGKDQPTPDEIESLRDQIGYVNPSVTPIPIGAETIAVQAWSGFPRAVVRSAPWDNLPHSDTDPDGRYRAVEHLGDEDHQPGVFVDQYDRILHLPVRDRQDEYLEWAAVRNSDHKITKLTFVAEGYDYYSALFENDEQRVLDLYKDATGLSALKVDDLRAKNGVYRRYQDGSRETIAEPGEFNPRNKFNINPGIVHLSHRANSLGAEINLAGVSALARADSLGDILDGIDPERLMCCNRGGNPNRNSDPLISAQAYKQVLDGFRYTLANPVGLYIAAIENGLYLPDDNNSPVPKDWWRIVRGHDLWDVTKSRVLRLELQIPKSEKLTISDLIVGGNQVTYEGQIAELISVHLFITRWRRNEPGIGPIVKCIATCCREQNSQILEFSKGICKDGFDLAYPDLLKPKSEQSALIRKSSSTGKRSR